MMKKPVFCMLIQIHGNLKLIEKILEWFWDSKIFCISRMNRCNELIVCMLIQIKES